MSETFEIYTEEQKKELQDIMFAEDSRRKPWTHAVGLMILDAVKKQSNALQDILETLQRIEAILLEQKNQ